MSVAKKGKRLRRETVTGKKIHSFMLMAFSGSATETKAIGEKQKAKNTEREGRREYEKHIPDWKEIEKAHWF